MYREGVLLKGQRLFFRSEAPGLVFSVTYLRGKLAPSAVLPASWRREARASPTDKPRKDGTLPPVTSEKPLSLDLPSRSLNYRLYLIFIQRSSAVVGPGFFHPEGLSDVRDTKSPAFTIWTASSKIICNSPDSK